VVGTTTEACPKYTKLIITRITSSRHIRPTVGPGPRASRINPYDGNFVWLSLILVGAADAHVRVVASGTIHDSRASDHRDNLEATPLPRAVFAATDANVPGSTKLTDVGVPVSTRSRLIIEALTAAGWTDIGALSQLQTRHSAAFFGD
jgi:hypothetical protein